MERKYDKADQEKVYERFINYDDNGSDNKNIFTEFRGDANRYFGSWSNFMNYVNSKNPDEVNIGPEKSKLLEIIDSVSTKQLQKSPHIAKDKIDELKKAGFPFDHLEYKLDSITPSNEKLRSLFYLARKYADENLR